MMPGMWAVAAAAAAVVAVLAGVATPASVKTRSLHVKVPRMAYVGEDAELECSFPWTDPSLLYSIKWWRNNGQFYQYIPKKSKPKMIFNVTGINVDPQQSTEFKVLLKALTLSSSGMFTCEVISDENFETFRKAANMTVIDPPDLNPLGQYGPVVSVAARDQPGLTEVQGMGPVEVKDGERVEAECVARGSNPPAQLTWYYNKTMNVSREHVRPQVSRLGHYNTYTTSVRLVLQAGHLWDSQGRLHISCSADIYDLFHATASVELHNPALRKMPFSGYFSGAAAVRSGVGLVSLLVTVTLMLPPSPTLGPRHS